MRVHKVGAVVRREYLGQVRTKGFWISTALIPVFLVAILVGPALFFNKQQGTLLLGCQDATGRIAELLVEKIEAAGEYGEPLHVTVRTLSTAMSPDDLTRLLLDGEIDAYVRVDESTIQRGEIDYRARVTTNIIVQERLENIFQEIFTAERLSAHGFDAAKIQELSAGIRLNVIEVGKEGESAGGEVRFAIAYVMFFLLYMMLIGYGQHILRGVLEEKSSRIVEVIISSLRPSELLLGKIFGIGAVGLTQVTVWVITAVVLAAGPSIGILASIGPLPSISPVLIFHFFFYFLVGFFLYATVFATVGAIHSNEQEAQQYNFVAMMPLIASVVLVFGVINAPTSTFSVVISFVPLVTPLIMLARVAVGAVTPLELVAADILLVAFVALEIWFAARIYRVGILMYGKRPTLPEVLRWARY